MNEDHQMTDDPSLVAKVNRIREELPAKNATIEMFSGLTYRGFVSGAQFGGRSRDNQPQHVGGYVTIDTAYGRARLDALDIKSWQVN